MQDNNKMDTLSERMNDLKKRGYGLEFQVKNNQLCNPVSDKTFAANQIKILEHYRFEGESDPGDMTVLYGIETPDGDRGILTDGFGTYSSEEQAEFIRKINELHKGSIY